MGGGGGVLDQRGDVESSPLKGLLKKGDKFGILCLLSHQVSQEGGELGEPQEILAPALLLVLVELSLAWQHLGLQQGAGYPRKKITC